KSRNHEAAFCSDLKRAVESAGLIFGSRTKIIEDRRLRECNYGDLTGSPGSKVDSALSRHISEPFPNGESCMDVEVRLKEFLKWLAGQPFSDVAIVAHKAPQLALEVLLNSKSWKQAIRDDWRLKEPKEWKPGWVYELQR
ncbi:histidine phosphatase family protein, partial [Candidatus Woesearchaeota archaeon]|nr:histidine phosphatase family protein [Candidatus Woesearchaeota archaeon]